MFKFLPERPIVDEEVYIANEGKIYLGKVCDKWTYNTEKRNEEMRFDVKLEKDGEIIRGLGTDEMFMNLEDAEKKLGLTI